MVMGLTKRLHYLLSLLYFSILPISVCASAVQNFAIFNDSDDAGLGQGVIVEIELARTPQEISRGLMFRNHLDEGQGMLFIFDSEQPRGFWMKNTLLPLDIIFISEKFRIVSAVTNAQPCRQDPCFVYRSDMPAKYVIEVNGGFMERHHILVGSKVQLKLGLGKNSPF